MSAEAPTTLPSPSPFRGRFLLDPNERAKYAEASGILSVVPSAVAVPNDRVDVQNLVRWADRTGTPLVPRSAATGMPGGNVGGGVAVDLLTSFSHIEPPDPTTRTLEVEVGATLAAVNARCEPHGLHFPVDPSSGARCTFGGMLANNSAGPHSVRYGATRRWVRELEVVLADGSLVHAARGTRPSDPRLAEIAIRVDALLRPEAERIEAEWPRVRKNASGYALREYLRSGDLVDLLIGSEGTLCLILSAVLELAPIPTRRALVILEFTDLELAGAAVESILAEEPATCEMLDRTFLELVRNAGRDDAYPLREGLEAILLVELEGNDDEEIRERGRRLGELADRLGARHTIALSESEQAGAHALRRAASPIIAEQAGGRVSMQFIEDCVVPVDRLAIYVHGLRAILARHHLPAVIFGHAGDGNLHVNPLVDVRADNWREEIEVVLYEVADLVATLGGTLSGEHGDGRLRAPLLETIWGRRMVERFRGIKDIFDPKGIFNPGVILPLPGQRPFDALRPFT
ncbi:MAG TPA: FAD-binding oxidoreductase [Longimicrobiaceae bacterium]